MASQRDSYMFLMKFEGLEPLSDHKKLISYNGHNSYTFNAKNSSVDSKYNLNLFVKENL